MNPRPSFLAIALFLTCISASQAQQICQFGVCCSALCGQCGGTGCFLRPGGSANCCIGTICSRAESAAVIPHLALSLAHLDQTPRPRQVKARCADLVSAVRVSVVCAEGSGASHGPAGPQTAASLPFFNQEDAAPPVHRLALGRMLVD